MTKKIIFFGAIAVIIIGVLAWLWYKYSQCKADEGKPCSAALRTAGGFVPAPVPTGKKINCNFWIGKSCS